jgi:hypothetical protein
MTIETNFEIGDTIFAYSPKKKKIVETPLYRIDISINIEDVKFQYWIKDNGAYEILTEVYRTKEDLIKAIS